MVIEWITPKTNWQASDTINYQDINRIVNNLKFLQRYVHGIVTVDYATMPQPNDYLGYPYADEINAIENNLETLNIKSYVLPIGTTREYKDNGYTLDFIELNRIESAELRLYERIGIGRKTLNLMEFTLGKQRGFRQ